MSLGIVTVLVFAIALWRIGFSLFIICFLGIGICEIFTSVLLTHNAGEELPDDASEGGIRGREKRARKSIRIGELLEGNDPDELFSAVFRRIVRRYGGDLNVMELKEHERVFLLAYDAWGLIGNGGFNYLFEKTVRGDPDFEETAAAFQALGCDAAAEAFAKAFELFPNGRPPEDVNERLRLYRRGPGARRGPIDEQFFSANTEIQRCLLAYVRSHREEFAELDRLPPRRRPRKKRNRRPHADGRDGPTAGDLVGSLPHWARVAFAARCGRGVWSLFTTAWPDARPERRQAISRAVELAEASASSAHAAEGLENAVIEAMIAAGGAMMGLYGFSFPKEDEEPLPPDGNAAVIAFNVARSMGSAAKAANEPPDKSVDAVLEAFAFARQAAGDASDLIQSLWRELTQLERVARLGGWTDQTAVPANVWDLLE